MSTLALAAQLMALFGRSPSALSTHPDDRTPVVSGSKVHPSICHSMADLKSITKLCVLVAVAAGGHQKLESLAGQGVPTVAAVVGLGGRVLSAAIADALGSLEDSPTDGSPSWTCQVFGVRGVAHAGQEKIAFLIRRELIAHGGDLQKDNDCAAALVASVVTTITVGKLSQ